MVVEQQVERPIDGMLSGVRVDVVLGAGEELALEALPITADRRRSAAGRDPGDPLASVHAIRSETGGDRAAVPSDPVGMEVERGAPRKLKPADPFLDVSGALQRCRPTSPSLWKFHACAFLDGAQSSKPAHVGHYTTPDAFDS